jgi:hypothetical protein
MDHLTKKTLLGATAVIEVATGLALMIWPSAVAMLLLGASLGTPAGLTIGRVAGAALLALGAACWFARHDGQSRSAAGLIVAMLLYNSAVALFLAVAGIVSGLAGIALWPAVILHAAMSVWCVANIRST